MSHNFADWFDDEYDRLVMRFLDSNPEFLNRNFNTWTTEEHQEFEEWCWELYNGMENDEDPREDR